jgi:hypothetical protein
VPRYRDDESLGGEQGRELLGAIPRSEGQPDAHARLYECGHCRRTFADAAAYIADVKECVAEAVRARTRWLR